MMIDTYIAKTTGVQDGSYRTESNYKTFVGKSGHVAMPVA